MMANDGSEHTAALPDRWDGDLWAHGTRVLPDPGPKVGIHWGDLLMLEKHLRDIQDGLRDIIRADAQDSPAAEGDYSDASLSASTTLDLALWLETQVRGLRTGHWPDDAHQGLGYASPANPALPAATFNDDDRDASV